MAIKCIKDYIKNINIVIGCTVGCRYCYARTNWMRFHTIDNFSMPEYFPNKLKRMKSKTSMNFLLTGESDFSDWKEEWINEVFEEIKNNPDNNYLFLTKRPEKMNLKCDLDNAWFGVTVTTNKETQKIINLREHIKAKHYHVSLEPLFEYPFDINFDGIDWIVLGTETGSRKGKISAKKEWILDLCKKAQNSGTIVFMKEHLVYENIINENEMIQEFPKEFNISNN